MCHPLHVPVLIAGGGPKRGSRVELCRQRYQRMGRGGAVGQQEMEGSQRNRANHSFIGKVDEQPGDFSEHRLDVGVVDVGQTAGVLTGLDVHQRDQLRMIGREHQESVRRQPQLLERFAQRRVEQALHVPHQPTEAEVDRSTPQLLFGAESLMNQVVAHA